MKVLVTGATTRFGATLVAELLGSSDVDHVLAVGHEVVPEHLPPTSSRLSYRAIDLTRSRCAHDLLFGPARDLGIDAVVHGSQQASALGTGRGVRGATVDVTRELLLQSERHPTIRRLVYRSSGEVYALRAAEPNLIDEDQPLEFDPAGPQWLRDRVEGDLTVCSRMGRSALQLAVLRCAEVLEPGTGSQLWDYLQSRICLRPLGFDPMINLLSLQDAVRAVMIALMSPVQGVFNIPGADTLPLSRIVRRHGRASVPTPGPLLAPLYRLRNRSIGLDFRNDLNVRRFQFGGVLDGTRAENELGYKPLHPLAWPSRRRAGRGRGNLYPPGAEPT